MIEQPFAAGQPCLGAATTQRAAPRQGKLPLSLLIGVVSLLLLAATALANTSAGADDETLAKQMPVPTPPPMLLISGHKNGEAETDNDEIRYRDEDIVSYVPGPDKGEGDLDIYFDGSDVGLAKADLEDFEVLLDGIDVIILFTLDKSLTIPDELTCEAGSLQVDDSDIVLFRADSLGTATAGCFELYLAGAAIGLTKGNEDVDALAIDPDGRLLISTIGNAKVNGVGNTEVEAKDEDLLVCEVFPPTAPPPAPTCALYFEGEDIKLTSGSEDLQSAWVDANGDQNHYLTTKGKYKAESTTKLSGDREEIIGCTPISLEEDPSEETECFLFEFLDADEALDWNDQIDGLWISFADPPPLPPLVAAAASQAETVVADDDAIDAADFAEAMSLADEEIDAYDFIDVVGQVYLPFVDR